MVVLLIRETIQEALSV